MPEGYERLRDALKRKGKSDEEAKRLAAAIWNKHHKDNPVTNKPHATEMSRLQLSGCPLTEDFEINFQRNLTFFGVGSTLADRILPGAKIVDEAAKHEWMAANRARQTASLLKTFLARQKKIRRMVGGPQ
jgi:hypothetical protein